MLVLSRIAVVTALLLVSTGPAYSQLSFDPSNPEESGVDGQLITSLADAISAGTFREVHGLLIVRGGKVLHESYYSGNRDYFDDNLNRVTPGDTLWDASMPHYVASVTKSMTSAAVGIALADHAVSVDSTVRDLIPNYRNRFFGLRETGITVRHLLTMTGGHEWDEWNTDDLTQMWRSGQDFIHFALAPAMAHDPGTFWRYNSGEANVLMGVVDALSGDAAGFIQERLFDPLEIGDYEWRTQPGGLPEAAARLFMRPR
ncbi:MAG: CubicO group peptidase (beta-lactamase class C family), partial [Thalassolituus oleivorans]